VSTSSSPTAHHTASYRVKFRHYIARSSGHRQWYSICKLHLFVLEGPANTISVLDTDEVISTFFIYYHFAGPELCPNYTGNTARDVYLRFERSFVQLDPRHPMTQNWTNATIIEAVLELLKEGIFDVASTPISTSQLLAAELMFLEEILSNGSLADVL